MFFLVFFSKSVFLKEPPTFELKEQCFDLLFLRSFYDAMPPIKK